MNMLGLVPKLDEYEKNLLKDAICINTARRPPDHELLLYDASEVEGWLRELVCGDGPRSEKALLDKLLTYTAV